MSTFTVSVCIPTYNGVVHLGEALGSLAAQQPFGGDSEIVISDSGSADGTLDLVERWRPRLTDAGFHVRVLPERTPGMVANWNAVSRAASGRWVKFLFQDDLLSPDCVAKMVRLGELHLRIGLVVTRRRLLIEPEAEGSEIAKYLRAMGDLDSGFTKRRSVQPGAVFLADRRLLSEPTNKIGEPTAVMIRRDLFEEVGYFNERMKQLVDLEMWLRLMPHCHVAIIDEPLVSFRVHGRQASSVQSSDPELHRRDYEELFRYLSNPTIYRYLHPAVRDTVRSECLKIGIGQKPWLGVSDAVYLGVRRVWRAAKAFRGGLSRRKGVTNP